MCHSITAMIHSDRMILPIVRAGHVPGENSAMLNQHRCIVEVQVWSGPVLKKYASRSISKVIT